MAGTASPAGFWQPKRAAPRVMDTATRCRPNRMRTSAILRPPKSSVNFQVETFKLYGRLRKAHTEVHNSLPTMDTIQTEKTLLSFDEQRQVTPDGANYDDFYRTLASSVTPQPSRVGTARSSCPSTRSLDSRHTSTHFSLGSAPFTSRPSHSRHGQSLFSGLGVGLRSSESRGTDRLSVSGFRALELSSRSRSTAGESRHRLIEDSGGEQSGAHTAVAEAQC